MKYLSIIISILFTIELYAQNFISSEQSTFYSNIQRLSGIIDSSLINNHKCGFRLINNLKFNYENYPSENKAIINSILARPTTQTSVISKNGFFRIHYDTAGTQRIKYSIQDLINAVDSAYNYIINYLGFLPPPSDGGVGGDNRYDIYVQNCFPYYGYTEFENPVGNKKYTSFMVIENSYDESSFYVKGINGARVTVAHEFFHAVQGGSYKFVNEDTYFYELSSTAMEEFVFDTINDYYNYMKELFNNPNKIISEHSGYDLALWNIYLNMFFDKSIFVYQWQKFIDNNALNAIKLSLEAYSSSFDYEFARFYYYNLFTGYRANSAKYYKEGAFYPLMQMNMNLKFSPPKKEISGSAEPLSANYYLMCDSINKYPLANDSIYIILVNTNINAAQNWKPGTLFEYKYIVSNSQLTSQYQKISSYLYSFLDVADFKNWSKFSVLNDTSSIYSGNNKSIEIPYPNPFYISKHKFINFIVGDDKIQNEVELKIYDVNMKLLKQLNSKPAVATDGAKIIRWVIDPETLGKLKSGVYFFTISADDIINKGKFVIIKDE